MFDFSKSENVIYYGTESTLEAISRSNQARASVVSMTSGLV
jgi:hypothetical protein